MINFIYVLQSKITYNYYIMLPLCSMVLQPSSSSPNGQFFTPSHRVDLETHKFLRPFPDRQANVVLGHC
jgi:hypothetical protein